MSAAPTADLEGASELDRVEGPRTLSRLTGGGVVRREARRTPHARLRSALKRVALPPSDR